MSKKTNEQRLLAESLSNALDPQQKRRGMPRDVLDQYDERPAPGGTLEGIPAGIPSAIPSSIPTGIPQGIPASGATKPPRRESSELFTYLDATHTASEKAVYSVMYRETVSKGLCERNFGPAELLKKTGIGSRNTVHKALYGLQAKLSIEVIEESRGNPLGPRYRVFKWQEIEERRKAADIQIDPQSKRIVGIPVGIPTSIPSAIPESGIPGIPESGIPGIPKTGMVINKEDSLSSESTKTDDEGHEGLIGLRSAMAAETGREVPTAALAELDELLTAEFRLAAGRAGSLSAPGAFFAEHLRRRLWKKEKRQLDEEGKSAATKTAPKADASQCPDCFGTGMYYPEGFEKGVAKCPHA